MKREEIKAIFPEATDEQLKSIMDLHGADVEKSKSKVTALEAELKEKTEGLEAITSDFNSLKEANASAEDWKAKYDEMIAEQKEKQEKAEAEAKAKATAERFNAVVGEKKFMHEAIKADYLHKFSEALTNEAYIGKSDADIFHDLTKDDANAFSNVSAIKLAGAETKTEDSEIKAIPTIF